MLKMMGIDDNEHLSYETWERFGDDLDLNTLHINLNNKGDIRNVIVNSRCD